MRGANATNKTLKIALLAVFFSVFFSATSFAEDGLEFKNAGPFVLDEALKPRVYFWIDIYAKYNSWETVLHDQKYPYIIYDVVKNNQAAKLASFKKKYAQILTNLHRHKKDIEEGKWNLDEEERRIYELFQNIPGEDKFLAAADPKRMRGQAGLKDNLRDALFMSGRYLPRMEKVFERFGLPTEIAYLPFVESGFNKKAVSKVGASGIWQFMPYTAKLFLHIDDVVDDRNDPMRAAEAAARLMKQNYELLKEWPLAITAYNHGALGVARAVKEVGSNSLSEIIAKYQGQSFGFASENFYACFLAALHVAENSSAYMGDVPRAKKLEFDEFVLPHYVEMKTLIKFLDLDLETIHELNPALTKLVYDGKRYVPVGYILRVPVEAREDFLAKYDAIPKELKFASQKSEAGPEVFGPPLPPDFTALSAEK